MVWVGQAGAIARPAPSAQLLAQASAAGICPAQLNGEISRILDRGNVARSNWSILVQTQGAAGSRRNLFNRNASTLLVPASNNKLFTTAAALAKLGAGYQIRTAVYGNSSQPNLTTLRIIGQGDPSLTTAQLQSLVQQVNQKGVRQVGTLIGDDTYFRGAVVNPNWDVEDTLAGYGAAVNSLILNQNAIGLTLYPQRVGQPLRVQWDDPLDGETWRIDNRSVTVSAQEGEFVDAVRDSQQWIVRVSGQLRAGSASELVAASVPNPGNYLVQRFRTLLGRAGITVTQSTLVRQTPAPAGEAELGAIESSPLSQLLVETNQQSNNVFAEALLKIVGRVQTPATQDATSSGTAAVKAILAPLGVNPNRYSMVDGAGLADRNRASAEALVQTLQAMALSPDAQVFRNSLPVAGVSGTLQNRFRNTAAQGRVAAKTGTISGAVSLSGYLTPPNFSPLVFSIVVNDGSVSAGTLRSAVDGVVLVLTRLRSC
jgi:D-alanyl-D-alanine carboxypeptidase/D-alanyl-D-alanine-endopeptidase (penicillin-binding protein 4)